MRVLQLIYPKKLILVACVSCSLSVTAYAAPPPMMMSATDDNSAGSAGIFGFLDGINRSSALLGDMWGVRRLLSSRGIALGIQETSEYLGNLTGGTQQGYKYDGLTQVVAQLNTQRAFGHYGGLFNVSLLNIHGKNLSADNLLSLQTASGIESDATTRLWEAWYDQKFLDEDRLDVKVGQISIDQEFMVSSNALYFVNTMFGWPALPSYDMPGGGNAYPLSALGARMSARPVDGITVLAGVFNGTPLDNNGVNMHGTSFPWSGGKLYIAEMQFAYPALGSMVEPGQTQPLGWTYRLGAWYNARDDFSAVSGAAVQYKGNYAVYGVADKLVWRDPADPNRTLAIFGRVMGTPLADRNLVDFSMNAGMVFHSPFRNRAADTFGVGMGYVHVSSQAPQQVLQNLEAIPRGEAFAELTYQYQLKPWIQIQPDIQYVVNPGAGVVDDGDQRIKNELVAGVRTNISF